MCCIDKCTGKILHLHIRLIVRSSFCVVISCCPHAESATSTVEQVCSAGYAHYTPQDTLHAVKI